MEFEDKNNKKKGGFGRLFFVIILVLLSFQAGMFMAGKERLLSDLSYKEAVYAGNVTGKYEADTPVSFQEDVDFSLFWEVWDALKNDYVDKDKLSDREMLYGALYGLVASAGDPYTVFMTPKISKDFSDDLAGTFEGIGAEIGIKNDVLTIIAPLPDMPAEKAGIKAGDKVLAIDGESTLGISVDEAVNRIRGVGGTDVALSILRDGEDAQRDITITRGKIVVRSIRTEVTEDNFFIIKIRSFNDDTTRLFNEAVREAIDKNVDGIILDLRNNPGGYLDTAIELSSEWIEDGVVVTEKYNEDKKIEHLARGRARLKSFPTVVLVNEGSASASEIVSGALKDYEAATIVGETTFGKGSVQTLTDFSDGSSVKITIAKWLTPSGKNISEEGISPDIEVDLTEDDYNHDIDPQMDKAVEVLKGGMNVNSL